MKFRFDIDKEVLEKPCFSLLREEIAAKRISMASRELVTLASHTMLFQNPKQDFPKFSQSDYDVMCSKLEIFLDLNVSLFSSDLSERSFRHWVGTRNKNYRKCSKEQLLALLKHERGKTPTTKVDSQNLRPLKTPSTQSSASEVLTKSKSIATPKMKMPNVLSKAQKRRLAVESDESDREHGDVDVDTYGYVRFNSVA